MNPQVVQYQEHLFGCVFNQGLKKFDQLVRVERINNDYPARLALIVHRGNHRQLVTRAAQSKCHRCFACWCEAPAPNDCVDQCGLIIPVNLSTLSLGLGLNGGGRLSQLVWPMVCSCAGVKLRPLPGFLPRRPGLSVAAEPSPSRRSAVLTAVQLQPVCSTMRIAPTPLRCMRTTCLQRSCSTSRDCLRASSFCMNLDYTNHQSSLINRAGSIGQNDAPA